MIDSVLVVGVFVLVLFCLVKLTWQDIHNNRLVDERQVYFILGAMGIGVFVATYNSGFLPLLAKLAIAITISLVFGLCLKLAQVDSELIAGMALLFLTYNMRTGMVFTITLLTTSVLYLGYNKLLWKPLPQPYLQVILVTWIITNSTYLLKW